MGPRGLPRPRRRMGKAVWGWGRAKAHASRGGSRSGRSQHVNIGMPMREEHSKGMRIQHSTTIRPGGVDGKEQKRKRHATDDTPTRGHGRGSKRPGGTTQKREEEKEKVEHKNIKRKRASERGRKGEPSGSTGSKRKTPPINTEKNWSRGEN